MYPHLNNLPGNRARHYDQCLPITENSETGYPTLITFERSKIVHGRESKTLMMPKLGILEDFQIEMLS
ncbi:hypothetical protein Y032_0002g648 [Ancylostoma ceylanicum]|nr:hypothetical protein Y032_0002g648 [Ancylostoma ceylanicum]